MKKSIIFWSSSLLNITFMTLSFILYALPSEEFRIRFWSWLCAILALTCMFVLEVYKKFSNKANTAYIMSCRALNTFLLAVMLKDIDLRLLSFFMTCISLTIMWSVVLYLLTKIKQP